MQIIPGALNRGAVGTAFLGRSPDGPHRAVFSVVLADGSLVQEHTAKNVDGLGPVGTLRPLLGRNWNDGDDEVGGTTPRVGVILNYSPDRILYYHLEHSFSYYSDTKSFDLTPRREKLRSADLFEAMGQAIKTTGPGPAITACFRCHSTGPVTVDAGCKVSIMEPDVRCERCQRPGSGHRPAVPRKADMAFWGECHCLPVSDLDWDSPWSVRYQPPLWRAAYVFRRAATYHA